MHDVYVEAAADGRIVVESDAPIPAGETLVLELARDLDVRSLVSVQVASSAASARRRHPPIPAGAERPSSRASSDGATQGCRRGARARPDRALARAVVPAIGVVTRRVPVRVRDVSASGCQLESLDSLPDGSIGRSSSRAQKGIRPKHCGCVDRDASRRRTAVALRRALPGPESAAGLVAAQPRGPVRDCRRVGRPPLPPPGRGCCPLFPPTGRL